MIPETALAETIARLHADLEERRECPIIYDAQHTSDIRLILSELDAARARVKTLEAVYVVRESEDHSEREKLAAWMILNSFATGHGDTIEDLLGELKGQIEERAALAESRLAQAVKALDEIAEHPGPNADDMAHVKREIAMETLASIRLGKTEKSNL